MKNYTFVRLDDFARNRIDACDKCVSLNDIFKEHFDKIYNNKNDIENLNHWSDEMNSWWKEVSSIILKQNNKKINFTDMTDWFFIGGNHAHARECFTNDNIKQEEKVYKEFCKILYNETNDVREALKKVNLL